MESATRNLATIPTRGSPSPLMIVPEEPVGVETIREAIRSGSYFPVGLPRTQRGPHEHFVSSLDLLLMVEKIMEISISGGNPIGIVVCNAHTNQLAGLKRENERKPKGERATDEKLEQEAIQGARLMGLKKKFEIEAVQEEIRRENPAAPRVPVYLLSELIDNHEFQTLHGQIRSLVTDDEAFAQIVYGCINKDRFPKGKPFKDFTPHQRSRALDAMAYIIYQITVTLFLQGTKLCHPGEVGYDNATNEAAKRLGCPLIKTDDLSLGGTNGVPYRAQRADRADEEDNAGLIADWRGTRESLADWLKMVDLKHYADETGEPYDDFLKMREAMAQRADEMKAQQLKKAGKITRIYRALLKIILAADMAEDERQAIIENTLMGYTQEAVQTLSFQAHFQWLFAAAGVTDVIEGRCTSSKLDNPNRMLPFQCPRNSNESEAAYFTRFVAELLRGELCNGPVGQLVENFMATLPIELSFAQNIWHQTCMYGLVNQGDTPTQHVESGKEPSPCWTMPCRNLRRKLFDEQCLPERPFGIMDPVKEEWIQAGQLFDLITGSGLEPIVQAYLRGETLPKKVELSIESGRKCRIVQTLTNPYFNHELRNAIITALSSKTDN